MKWHSVHAATASPAITGDDPPPTARHASPMAIGSSHAAHSWGQMPRPCHM